MTADDSGRFFDAIARRYDRAYALPTAESRHRMARVLRELPATPARLLDLGVGPGRELTALLDAGHSPTGLDVSQAMLDICAQRARPVPLVLADFWRVPLPFADATFDAALALHGSLAHPPTQNAVSALARELSRVVGFDGRFVAEVPSIGWLDAVASLPPTDDRRIVRTGARTCLFEDLVVGASIHARLLDESEWRDAFAPNWRARLESMGPFEWLIVADRL
jgi:SAM-dependent methyltransferase